MADKIPDINYTNRDFISLITEFKKLIPFFTPEWTDHNSTDLGITLAELLAYSIDILNFYSDRNAAEGFLGTAITQESVDKLLALIDYRRPGPTSATVDLKFTLPAIQTSTVLIPKGTKCQTTPVSANDVALFFETVSDLNIIAGNLDGTIGAEEGESFEENFTSNGNAFQRIVPSRNRILENTVQVFVTETIEEQWTKLTTLSGSLGTDKVYITSFDSQRKMTVLFGDNGQGKIPQNGANIRVRYKVGGGVLGNVGANTINKVVSPIIYMGGPISVSVTNLLSASGGGNGQTIAEAKLQGPLTLRTLNRAVTLQDIETLAKQVSGVAKAKAIQRLPVVLREIDLYIAPNGGGIPADALLNNVITFLDDKKVAGTTIYAQKPRYVNIDLVATVNVFARFIQADVKLAVESAIDSLLKFDSLETAFGKAVRLSDILRAIDEVTGVDYVDLSEFHFRPIDTVRYEVWTGNSVFETITLGNSAVLEDITISFINSTQYTVFGSVSGAQVALGTINSTYTMSLNQVTFKITSVTIPNASGDRAKFRSQKIADNIFLLDDEIRQKGSITLTFVGGA